MTFIKLGMLGHRSKRNILEKPKCGPRYNYRYDIEKLHG
jgi:hypothetical protein